MISVSVRCLLFLGAWAVASGAAYAQAQSLTAQDRADIEELNTRFAQAVDFNIEDGGAWADTFTNDGVFVLQGRKLTGRAALMKHVTDLHAGEMKGALRHVFGNLSLRAVPGGAAASEYVVVYRIGDPTTILTIVQYEDFLVNTDQGWRIKRREVVTAKTR